MMKKLLPILLILIGSGAGVGAGIFLRPPPPEPEMHGDADQEKEETHSEEEGEPIGLEYVKMSNQFVVPVVSGEQVIALVVLSLSLEVPEGQRTAVLAREPKLRDSFLRVLFDHANAGGFEGSFTQASNMESLRTALFEVGQKDLGADIVKDVLIGEIARQDY